MLSFAVKNEHGNDDEWMFNSLTRFKSVYSKYRDTLPDDDASVSWCNFDGEDMYFGTFRELCDEFL